MPDVVYPLLVPKGSDEFDSLQERFLKVGKKRKCIGSGRVTASVAPKTIRHGIFERFVLWCGGASIILRVIVDFGVPFISKSKASS